MQYTITLRSPVADALCNYTKDSQWYHFFHQLLLHTSSHASINQHYQPHLSQEWQDELLSSLSLPNPTKTLTVTDSHLESASYGLTSSKNVGDMGMMIVFDEVGSLNKKNCCGEQCGNYTEVDNSKNDVSVKSSSLFNGN